MIKIAVRDVKSKGLDIDQVIPKEGIGLSDEEIDLRSPLHISARLKKIDNVIIADTEVKADYGYLCARCLDHFERQEIKHYHFDFPLEPELEFIDLGEEIRQELILGNPARILCAEDCKGICPKCGANLNTEACRCKH